MKIFKINTPYSFEAIVICYEDEVKELFEVENMAFYFDPKYKYEDISIEEIGIAHDDQRERIVLFKWL
jgi:hypothetical protein